MVYGYIRWVNVNGGVCVVIKGSGLNLAVKWPGCLKWTYTTLQIMCSLHYCWPIFYSTSYHILNWFPTFQEVTGFILLCNKKFWKFEMDNRFYCIVEAVSSACGNPAASRDCFDKKIIVGRSSIYCNSWLTYNTRRNNQTQPNSHYPFNHFSVWLLVYTELLKWLTRISMDECPWNHWHWE